MAGYSLAGLLALYAVCRADVFSRVGCMSGSLWSPGFRAYIFSHKSRHRLDCICFPLVDKGAKGAKARDPILKTVQKNAEEIRAFYRRSGIDTVLQLNPGSAVFQAEDFPSTG